MTRTKSNHRRSPYTRRSVLQTLGSSILGLGCALVVSACNGASGAGPGGGPGGKAPGGRPGGRGKAEGDPLAVELTTLEPATIERHYRAAGTLEALRRAEIRPIRSGIILTLEAEVGDAVEADQVLARLDGRELSLQAKRDALTADNARRELDRLEQLEHAGAIAQEELDALRYELETAQAEAHLSRTQARTMTVRAPFAGTLVSRDVDVGNLASTSTTLFEIADLSAIELPLHLPEREAASVTLGAEVSIELVDDSHFTGRVIRRAPIVDPLTGTVEFLVRAEEFPSIAVPGAFVRVEVLLERHEDVPSLPLGAVFELEGQRYVYLLREGKARRTLVEVGLEGSERVEVLAGIDAGARVLVDAGGITEGMAVKGAGEPDPEPPEDADAGEDAKAEGGPPRSGGWGSRRKRP
ncbi:efflux RND transporter periplasmic adaptor subunit [Pseudenhygromyxa sp. WMMC2535]|uniref:efflux RND transporter periplasmic adaptor subunit n=1 Tax=Pseudenhygromyxa sp. WMMC2535 TaxID=2712867 RepID=UPI001553B494|nr:efflux RND transporter periplasmic adaptor subunit [Pseudenhygromyxa sp. WMMC2535]NVB38184.1 efflux RND transporter periplasmic adaptor subunit [Pseudenhygromyxa sp. WMMC2535]